MQNKPRPYKKIQRDFETEGEKIRSEMATQSYQELEDAHNKIIKKRKQLGSDLQSMGFQGQSESMLKSAYDEAGNGNFGHFGKKYRAVEKDQDEHFATQNQAHFIYGYESSSVQFIDSKHEQKAKEIMQESLMFNSLLRSDTQATGYNLSSQSQMQHSTKKTGGLFGSTGKNHNTQDRQRAEIILSDFKGSSKKGAERLWSLSEITEGTTQSMFQAPTKAKNQNLMFSNQTLNDNAFQRRETTKSLFQGASVSGQKKDSDWKPSQINRGFSPPRDK